MANLQKRLLKAVKPGDRFLNSTNGFSTVVAKITEENIGGSIVKLIFMDDTEFRGDQFDFVTVVQL